MKHGVVTYNISGSATVVSPNRGRIFKFVVNTAGSGAGTISDCATTGAVAATNKVCNIPATVGIYEINWPVTAGIVVTPGTSQVIAIHWE